VEDKRFCPCSISCQTPEATPQTLLPRPKWQQAKPSDRQTTQQMLSLFRASLWEIAVNSNVTRFAAQNPKERTAVYSNESLAAAVCYAQIAKGEKPAKA
jgi:hypothetical protein